MKSTVLWTLIILNVVLLASFIGRYAGQSAAMAQNAAPVRRQGDYLEVPMSVQGLSAGIIVVVDQTNGDMTAMSYDDTSRSLVHMPKIDLTQVFSRGNAGRK